MDPPACVQNAMMTKDKKPFTYTPGGINLSEIRSPRLGRRIERNAQAEGVTNVPQAPHPPQTSGPLPPSAMAAMRPQTQVQVFPSPPPPPPMQKNIPAPPPPPSGPMPTQKVVTADNQVLVRPDMTKIIPENPMKLLRKTGGPAPRKSIVDELFSESNKAPQAPQSPPYHPPVIERQPISPPVQQQVQQPPRQPNTFQQNAQHNQQFQPARPQQQQYQQGSPESPRPQPFYQPPSQQHQESPKIAPPYQPPVIERQPSLRNEMPAQKNAALGSLYIPPANQQQNQQPSGRTVAPPTPPERSRESQQVQSPGTPTLKEAPRPWQVKKPKSQDEIPPWTKRDEQNGFDQYQQQSPPVQQNVVSQQQEPPQQRWQPQQQQTVPTQQQQQRFQPQAPPQDNRQPKWQPQSPPQQQSQNRWPQPQPQQQPQQQYRQPQSQPNTLRINIITDPKLLQQESEEDHKPNAVYVTQPIVLQHPGGAVPPPHVIVVPREQLINQKPQINQRPQQVQQRPQQQVENQGTRIIPIQVEGRGTVTPASPGNDRTLNRQQSWTPPQSNSFKVLQKITNTTEDDDDDTPITHHSPRYPQNFQQPPNEPMMNKFKQGADGPQKYIPPSEQTVPEPKKYTGSNIPSRSFKILQAMTAPDSCANADDNEELPLDPRYYPDPYYPYRYPLPPPYWRPNLFCPEQSGESTPEKNERSTPRSTPVPYWGFVPPPPPYVRRRSSSTSESENDNENKSTTRKANKSIWRHSYPYAAQNSENFEVEDTTCPPFMNPYFYPYFYGYPPYMPMPPVYRSESRCVVNKDEITVCEQGNINTKRKVAVEMRNKQTRAMSTTNATTKVFVNEDDETTTDSFFTSDSESEQSEDNGKTFGLKSIRSVNNINAYYENGREDDEIGVEEYIVSEDADDTDETSSYANEDEIDPHQLSVIYEESERTETRVRPESVISDSTTVAEQSDPDEYCNYLESEAVLPPRSQTRIGNENEQDDSEKEDDHEEEDVIENACQNDSHSTNQIECENRNSLESDQVQNNDDEKESDEDWWSIIGKREEELPQPIKGKAELLCTTEIKVEECAVQDEVEKSPITEEECNKSVATEESSQVVVMRKKRNKLQRQISSIYDEVNQEEEETGSSYLLLEIESFTDKLEQIKRNSGLWNFNNNDTEFNSETDKQQFETECRKNSGSGQTSSNNLETNHECDLKQTDDSEKTTNGVEENNEEEEEIDFWSKIKSEDSDEELNIRRRSLKHFEEYDSVSSMGGSSLNRSTVFPQTSPAESENQIYVSSHDAEKDSASLSEQKMNVTTGTLSNETTDNTPIRYEIIPYDNECSKSAVSSISTGKNIRTNTEGLKSKNEVVYNRNENRKETANISDNESRNSCSSISVVEKLSTSNEVKETDYTENEKTPSPLTIKERIQALQASIEEKKKKLEEKDEIKICVKERISVLEMSEESRSKTVSTKSSVKSFEEYSEEEGDSGVISDISRHISDTEEFPELKKLSKYQRAATHSRLFKLLQDECELEDTEEAEPVKEDKFSRLSVRQRNLKKEEIQKSPSRNQLSLPLTKCTEDTFSASCSSRNSPGSPVNEKLAVELVQSLLKRKKGQMFRNVPKEKLLEAAKKILQEDLDCPETPSDCTSFLSPLLGETQVSTPAQTPQEFYGNSNEYKQYYESWSDAEQLYDENYDILPSKAFKLLQEHTGANRIGIIEGLLAKCPRILSSKNVHKQLMRLLDDDPDCSSSNRDQNTQVANDVANTS